MNKKICIIAPTLQRGGMERVVSVIANTLSSLNYVIVVITLINNRVEYNLNKKVTIIHINNNDIYKKGIFNKLNIIYKLTYTLKVIKPNVVLGFSEVFNPISIFTAKLNGIKVFISDRSNPLLKHKIRDRVSRMLLYPFSNGMIAQTELAKEVFVKRKYNKNILVLANPLIDFNNTQIIAGTKTIITVGRLVSSKNQEELIFIFEQICNLEWKLIIIGDGPLQKHLKQVVKNKNLENNIIFTGNVNDIEYWLSKGSIFAYTSLSEGFPNALSEAMAYPLACIAYDCPAGVKDLIKDGYNGFLIPLNNRGIYIEKLKNLMSDTNLRKKFMFNSMKNRELYKKENISSTLADFLFSNTKKM